VGDFVAAGGEGAAERDRKGMASVVMNHISNWGGEGGEIGKEGRRASFFPRGRCEFGSEKSTSWNYAITGWRFGFVE
jgi:hypothetical protein